MKIRFYVDGNKEQTLTTELLGYTDHEWKELSDMEKNQIAEDWAFENISIGYEEIE